MKRALAALALFAACSRQPRGQTSGPSRPPAAPLVVIDAAPEPPRADVLPWKDFEHQNFDPPHIHIENAAGELYIWDAKRPDGPATLTRMPPTLEPKWRVDVPSDFVPGAAMVADDNRIYLVHHSVIDSGGEAMAFAVSDGHLIWRTRLQALGPVAHSEYLNQLAVELVPTSAIVIYGDEASGRYIEVLDLNGNLRSTHMLPHL